MGHIYLSHFHPIRIYALFKENYLTESHQTMARGPNPARKDGLSIMKKYYIYEKTNVIW